MAKPASERSLIRPRNLLQWLYVGRLTLVTGIFVAAIRLWFEAQPSDTLLVAAMFISAAGVTVWSFWFTHITTHEPSENFLYAQVVLDALIVTGIVHVTGGPDSGFESVYILVIAAGALLLPLPGGVLIGALASSLYFADLVWGYQETFSIFVGLRIALFTGVALVTGFLGDRLRRAGQALGAVASELAQLRLDTGDILANLTTGVITVDGDGRLAYANPAADNLLGYDVSRCLGQPVFDQLDRIAPELGCDVAAGDPGGHPGLSGSGDDLQHNLSCAAGVSVPRYSDELTIRCRQRRRCSRTLQMSNASTRLKSVPSAWKRWPRFLPRSRTRSRTRSLRSAVRLSS